ncbi:hypothetical protein HK104_007180, partial [Borealophlyctis nickersoniae]
MHHHPSLSPSAYLAPAVISPPLFSSPHKKRAPDPDVDDAIGCHNDYTHTSMTDTDTTNNNLPRFSRKRQALITETELGERLRLLSIAGRERERDVQMDGGGGGT